MTPEGSLFNSYYTEGATLFSGLLHFTLDPHLIVLTAKQVASSTIFWVFVWVDLGLNPGLPDHWQTLYSFSQWPSIYFNEIRTFHIFMHKRFCWRNFWNELIWKFWSQNFFFFSYNQDINAYYYLGICFETGYGVDLNKSKAAEFFMKAAENGHSEAQYCLANYYEHELGGKTGGILNFTIQRHCNWIYYINAL